MRSSIRTRLAAVVVALVALMIVKPAMALEPADTAGRAQLSGGPRFGSDNLNFGLGVRGGYTLDMNLYLGGASTSSSVSRIATRLGTRRTGYGR